MGKDFKPKTVNELEHIAPEDISSCNFFVMKPGATVAKRLNMTSFLAAIMPRSVNLVIGEDIEVGADVQLLDTETVANAKLNLATGTILALFYNGLPVQVFEQVRGSASLKPTSVGEISEGYLQILFTPITI